ncbi:hypothetical protein GQR58_021426 [Nymphon striatum]|nr:hypothetical protein GQR58_021426 [Nymphon striatum]
MEKFKKADDPLRLKLQKVVKTFTDIIKVSDAKFLREFCKLLQDEVIENLNEIRKYNQVQKNRNLSIDVTKNCDMCIAAVSFLDAEASSEKVKQSVETKDQILNSALHDGIKIYVTKMSHEDRMVVIVKSYVKLFNGSHSYRDSVGPLADICNLIKEGHCNDSDEAWKHMLGELNVKLLVKIALEYSSDSPLLVHKQEIISTAFFVMFRLSEDQICKHPEDFIQVVDVFRNLIVSDNVNQTAGLIEDSMKCIIRISKLIAVCSKMIETGIHTFIITLIQKIDFFEWDFIEIVCKFSTLFPYMIRRKIHNETDYKLISFYFDVQHENVHKDLLELASFVSSTLTEGTQDEAQPVKHYFMELAKYCADGDSKDVLPRHGFVRWIYFLTETEKENRIDGICHLARLLDYDIWSQELLQRIVVELSSSLASFRVFDENDVYGILDVLNILMYPDNCDIHPAVINSIRDCLSNMLSSTLNETKRSEIVSFLSAIIIYDDFFEVFKKCPPEELLDFITKVLNITLAEFSTSLTFEASETGLLSEDNYIKFTKCHGIFRRIILSKGDSMSVYTADNFELSQNFTKLLNIIWNFIRLCFADMNTEERHIFYFRRSHAYSGVFEKLFKIFFDFGFVADNERLRILYKKQEEAAELFIGVLKFNVNKVRLEDGDFVDLVSYFIRKCLTAGTTYLAKFVTLPLRKGTFIRMTNYFSKACDSSITLEVEPELAILNFSDVFEAWRFPTNQFPSRYIHNFRKICFKIQSGDFGAVSFYGTCLFQFRKICLNIIKNSNRYILNSDEEFEMKQFFGSILNSILIQKQDQIFEATNSPSLKVMMLQFDKSRPTTTRKDFVPAVHGCNNYQVATENLMVISNLIEHKHCNGGEEALNEILAELNVKVLMTIALEYSYHSDNLSYSHKQQTISKAFFVLFWLPKDQIVKYSEDILQVSVIIKNLAESEHVDVQLDGIVLPNIIENRLQNSVINLIKRTESFKWNLVETICKFSTLFPRVIGLRIKDEIYNKLICFYFGINQQNFHSDLRILASFVYVIITEETPNAELVEEYVAALGSYCKEDGSKNVLADHGFLRWIDFLIERNKENYIEGICYMAQLLAFKRCSNENEFRGFITNVLNLAVTEFSTCLNFEPSETGILSNFNHYVCIECLDIIQQIELLEKDLIFDYSESNSSFKENLIRLLNVMWNFLKHCLADMNNKNNHRLLLYFNRSNSSFSGIFFKVFYFFFNFCFVADNVLFKILDEKREEAAQLFMNLLKLNVDIFHLEDLDFVDLMYYFIGIISIRYYCEQSEIFEKIPKLVELFYFSSVFEDLLDTYTGPLAVLAPTRLPARPLVAPAIRKAIPPTHPPISMAGGLSILCNSQTTSPRAIPLAQCGLRITDVIPQVGGTSPLSLRPPEHHLLPLVGPIQPLPGTYSGIPPFRRRGRLRTPHCRSHGLRTARSAIDCPRPLDYKPWSRGTLVGRPRPPERGVSIAGVPARQHSWLDRSRGVHSVTMNHTTVTAITPFPDVFDMPRHAVHTYHIPRHDIRNDPQRPLPRARRYRWLDPHLVTHSKRAVFETLNLRKVDVKRYTPSVPI